MITTTTILATLATFVNCIQQLPQLYKIVTTKKAKDLSLHSLLLVLIGNFLWFFYGYFIVDAALLISGIITITINVILLIMFFIYKKNG
jgi:uncharacterized protein with PQ loop repeat